MQTTCAFFLVLRSSADAFTPHFRSHCVKVLKPHSEWIRSALPSLDGRLILTCSDDHVCNLSFLRDVTHRPQTARISDLESGAMKVEMRGHDNRIESAVFVPVVSIPAVRELVALVSHHTLTHRLKLKSICSSLQPYNLQKSMPLEFRL